MADEYQYNDIDLAKDFSKGDKKAFEEIYYRHYNRLYVFCRNFIDNQDEVRDIINQTFTKLLTRHQDFDNMPDILGFLYVTARNDCFDYLRSQKLDTEKKKKLSDSLDAEPQIEEAKIEIDLMYGEFLQEVYRSIDSLSGKEFNDLILTVRESMESLPERSGQVIKLLYIEGLKYSEVAERLNISTDTVDSQRRFAIRKLKKMFSEKRLIVMGLMQFFLLVKK
jgi:RNA polymerase sigma factor (sigma-70 family)